MIRATVIGHFGENQSSSDGQTIKTRSITEALEKKLGCDNVSRIDTHGGMKTLLHAHKIVETAFRESENVIILPAENGLRVFAPLCALHKRKHSNVKLHYIVIGGWLPQFLKKNRFLIMSLSKFDGIYVETSTMKRMLDEIGLQNIIVMPNCKNLEVLSEDKLVYSLCEPLKLCTFSRIMKEKGIEDAVSAVVSVNNSYGRIVYELDLYGQIAQNQIDWFEHLRNKFPDYVKYRGVISYEKSVDTLKEYYALLFPTHFYTEGIPGTIIDAFSAGVPVIASKWQNYNDLIEDNVTGIGYDYEQENGLINVLTMLAEKPETLHQMKAKCLISAQKYMPENAINILFWGNFL